MSFSARPFTLKDARELARKAHAGQTDLLGVDYMHHVEAVAAGLIDFDLDVQIAGMLHDVVEDSDFTLEDLRRFGVSERSLTAVALVSRNLHPQLNYLEAISKITESLDATLVKIADNAHNSDPDRIIALEQQKRDEAGNQSLSFPPNPRYAQARELLYSTAPAELIEKILKRVNPSLLVELKDSKKIYSATQLA